jgi:GDPmannose 4,6-dehydratase
MGTMYSNILTDFAVIAQNRHPSGLSIITGSRGQNGSYLRDLLGHDKTIGCINPHTSSRERKAFNEVCVDLGDKDSVTELLNAIRPTTIFHMAARHGSSTNMTYEKEDIEMMQKLHVDATRNFLEGIESLRLDTHLIVAGSSRIFTPSKEITMIAEDSQPNPQDFYGETKLAAWKLVKDFRKKFGIKASFLVLFNHESPRRPAGYFSRDLARATYEYLVGDVSCISVFDADAWGDWSDARDVVALMTRISNLNIGDDFVVASGTIRNVREIISKVLEILGENKTPEVRSTRHQKTENRFYMYGQNQKSVKSGIWKPKIPIEQTIVEMIKSEYLSKGNK